MKYFPSLFLLLCGIVLLVGCAADKRIIFVTNTQVGARVGVDSRQIPEIVAGYNRQEAALVPIYVGIGTDGDGGFNPESASIVKEARLLIDNARVSGAVNWAATGKAKVASASTLLGKVIASAHNYSLPLKEASGLATALSGNANAPSDQEYGVLLSYLNAELGRPFTAAAYDRDGRVFATYNTKTGERIDALSVIGTFSGNGKGKSATTSGVEAGGSIAQYFATGMAAQILAEKAGAAAISANAEPASNSEAKYAALDNKLEERQKVLDDLLKKSLKITPTVFDGSSYSTTQSLADAMAAKKRSTVGTIRRRGGNDLEDLITQLTAATN